MRLRPLLLLSMLVAVGGCGDSCPFINTKDAGPILTGVTGCGTATVGGTEKSYALVGGESELLLLMKKGPDCPGFFHSHIVNARAAIYEFSLNRDNPSASTLTARVFTAGLDNDDPADRARFSETSAQNLSGSDRNGARVSMLDEMEADQFAEMTFTATDMSTLEGTGTAPVVVNLKGRQSTITMQATAEWSGDRLTITGTAVLNGGNHNIPKNRTNQCMDANMDMQMKLVFEPVENCEATTEVPDGGPPFAATFFPPQGVCAATTGFTTVDSTVGMSPGDVLNMRCGGCHTEPTHMSASISLVTWEDYRYDSERNPDTALMNTAVAFMRLDPFAAGSMVMPPLTSGVIMPEDEIALVERWVQEGGHLAACDGSGMPEPVGAPRMYTPVAPAVCGALGAPIWNDVKCFFGAEIVGGGVDPDCTGVTNGQHCAGCHAQGLPQVTLTTHQGGTPDGIHAFYRQVTGVRTDGGALYPGIPLWQVAVARVEDGTMPPGLPRGDTVADSTQLDLLTRWVNAGFPQTTCADGGVPTDAGSADAGPGVLQSVLLTTPNGGETLSGMVTVTWTTTTTSTVASTATVSVLYGGLVGTGQVLSAVNIPNTGSFTFDSSQLLNGTDYRFRVLVRQGSRTRNDASDGDVTISNTLGDGGPNIGTALRYTDVKPALDQYCAACHTMPTPPDAGATVPQSFVLDVYGRTDGGIPGVYSRRERIRTNLQANDMPPANSGYPLLPAGTDHQNILDWVAGGAPE